jgi:hypothetical protein
LWGYSARMDLVDGLWMPERVEQAREQQEGVEGVAAALAFRRRLKELDSRLDLFYSKPTATAFKPHRWIITRRNDLVPDSYWLVEGEDGEYCEPSDKHFQRLQEYDTQAHADVWKRMEREQKRRRESGEKKHEEKRREFREKLLERLDHEFETTVPVTSADKAALDRKPSA